ncbi:hypothetical protein ACN6LF_004652 [[Kitasatospora] papulosa]|uniref:hypothetical protein n=1 Tax=Streptomyces TaxID=1883 RepID=UPI002275AD46|nr:MULTISPECIES: hypothetical protein [unclassified Streptomyces]MCY1649273.1 hypothetical protein [Streptomyces sp. SL203]MCY1676986.1 hypothetical protein [Streptomyces sp. SL294]
MDEISSGRVPARRTTTDLAGQGTASSEAAGVDSLPGGLKPEVRAWVVRLRELVDNTGMSARAYCMRHDLATSTMSRWRNGRTMPGEPVVNTLLENQLSGLAPELTDHTWALWEAALQVSSRHEYEKHQLRSSVKAAKQKISTLSSFVESLERDVQERERDITDLNRRVTELADALSHEAIQNHNEREHLQAEIAQLIQEREELKTRNETTLHSLSDAERARDQALGQARDAGEKLRFLEEEAALQLEAADSDGQDAAAAAAATIEELESRITLLLAERTDNAVLRDEIGNLQWRVQAADMHTQERTEALARLQNLNTEHATLIRHLSALEQRHSVLTGEHILQTSLCEQQAAEVESLRSQLQDLEHARDQAIEASERERGAHTEQLAAHEKERTGQADKLGEQEKRIQELTNRRPPPRTALTTLPIVVLPALTLLALLYSLGAGSTELEAAVTSRSWQMPLYVFASFALAVAALRGYTLLLRRHRRVYGLARRTGRYSALLAVTMMAAYISGVYMVDPLPHLQDLGRLIQTSLSG